MEKDEDEGWTFFEEFAEKTMLWESTREPTREPRNQTILPTKRVYIMLVTLSQPRLN